MDISAQIADRSVLRDEVLDWEAKRAAKVATTIGGVTPASDLSTFRQALVDRKLELGHDAIEDLLSRELRWSERVGRMGAAASRGRRKLSTIELQASEGAAETVPQWYHDAITANNEAPLLAACPDHYLSRTRPDGRQEVIETTGGAPMAVRMFFDDSDLSTLTSARDGAFPVEWAAIARNAGGTPVGGIRHQFRDEVGGGFRVRLTVEFPALTPPHMISAHRWHLACEFSNWIEMANATL